MEGQAIPGSENRMENTQEDVAIMHESLQLREEHQVPIDIELGERNRPGLDRQQPVSRNLSDMWKGLLAKYLGRPEDIRKASRRVTLAIVFACIFLFITSEMGLFMTILLLLNHYDMYTTFSRYDPRGISKSRNSIACRSFGILCIIPVLNLLGCMIPSWSCSALSPDRYASDLSLVIVLLTCVQVGLVCRMDAVIDRADEQPHA